MNQHTILHVLLMYNWAQDYFSSESLALMPALHFMRIPTTSTASVAAAFTWIIFDVVRGKKPGALGTCIGAVVGLVAITPAAGFITIPQ